MSNHRAALDMLQEKIEAVQKDVDTARHAIEPARINYQRKCKDAEALEYELAQLLHTQKVLMQDAKLGEVQVHPS